ncbi:DoxX family protein [Chitinophagaceae bacterium MMS25-I14]
MKKLLSRITQPFVPERTLDITLFLFRILVSAELIVAHGLRKVAVGTGEAEIVPNPLHLPAAFNQAFATAANLVFPVLVMLGFLTRLSVLPIIAVTVTGFFLLHLADGPAQWDAAYTYAVMHLLLLVLGPGRLSADYIIYKRTGL